MSSRVSKPAFRRRQLEASCRNSEHTGMAEGSTAWPPNAMEILCVREGGKGAGGGGGVRKKDGGGVTWGAAFSPFDIEVGCIAAVALPL